MKFIGRKSFVNKIFLLGSVVLFFSCEKMASLTAENSSREIKVEDLPADIHIPVGLWDAIEGKNTAGAAKSEKAEKPEKSEKPAEHGAPAASGGEEGGGGTAAAASGALFMNVDVILTEKNPGVLKHPSIRIHLPRGGGAIDFANLTGEQPGSFFVQFAWPETEDGQDVQTWFVSKARKRKIGKEVWGAGCGKYFKLTTALNQLQKESGLKMNTTRNRHLTVLGGHFIFATRKSDQTFLSQVTFKDSRFENLYCEEL